MMTWMHQHKKGPQIDMAFRAAVSHNIEVIIKRAETMACKLERDQVRISLSKYRAQLLTVVV